MLEGLGCSDVQCPPKEPPRFCQQQVQIEKRAVKNSMVECFRFTAVIALGTMVMCIAQ